MSTTTVMAPARSVPWIVRIAMAVIVAYVVIAATAPLIAPYGQTEIAGDPGLEWGAGHVFGTDDLGRDVLSRLLFGIRNTVVLAFVINLLAFAAGITLGLLAASIGGWVDSILSRIVDTIMALPQLILALLLISIFGSSVGMLIAITVLIDFTRVFRLARAVSMNIVVMPFVETARLRGESIFWCMRREVLPNVVTPLLAEFGIRFCYVFLFISGLSFLGLGLQPPAADLGSMVRESSTLISFGDLTPLVPAATIALLTISVNLVIDWMLHRASGLDE